MKKMTWITALVSAALLSACAHYDKATNGLIRVRDNNNPEVTIKDGKVAVTPSTLYFRSTEKDTKITWKLPALKGMKFAKDGVVIEGEILNRVIRGTPNSVALDAQQTEVVNCEIAADGLSFTCLNRNTRAGIYKYTLRIQVGDRIYEVDPPIVNML